jgi:large subunit ribosomal protein L6
MADAQTSVVRQSRIGKRPIAIPKGVTVNVTGSRVEVQGPKGKLATELPSAITINREGDSLKVVTDAPPRELARLQGLGRALLASMVKGAAEGYERILEMVGTGYRCEVKGRVLNFSLGFSHPAQFELPPQVSAMVPPDSKGTILILSSADKAALGQVAATVRGLRPPEPYGGKGIRYRGEAIRKKAGKAGKAAGGKK